MLYYSVLYTLGKPAIENLYVYMFLLFLQSLKRTGTLGDDDQFVLLVDDECRKILEGNPNCARVKFISIPKITTHLQGMSFKYRLHHFMPSVKNKDCMYLDIDIAFIKYFRINIPEDTLIVIPEGNITDSNYCGDMKINTPIGVSAGFFAYNCGERVQKFLDDVFDTICRTDKKYYTIEQPFFNKHLEGMRYLYLNNSILSFNGHTNQNTAVAINFCGEPGKDGFHFYKMFNFLLQKYFRSE